LWLALAWGKTVVIHIRLWLDNLRKTDGVGGLGVDVEIILKGIFKKYNGTVWNGFI
jgi:hypothetical protein